MAANSHWEVVGKTSKKVKNPVATSYKSQKQSFLDNAPRLDTSVPVKESPTIYDVFLLDKKEAKRSEITANGKDSIKDSIKSSSDGSAKNKSQQATKKKGTTAVEKKVTLTLEEAVAKLDASELETVLINAKTMFSGNPNLWLKDLASILNLRLDSVPEEDPLFEGKPVDYPSSLLTSKVRKVLTSTLRECPEGVLTIFFEHCVNFMINDMGKNVPAHGYRIFIQLMCFENPLIALRNIGKYKEMIDSQLNRPLRCMSIMWAVGQAGIKDLSRGLQIWLDLMFPMLKIRSLSSYSVDYLDQLLKLHGDQKTADGVVGLRNFFPILDMVYLGQSSLPSTLQKKLKALYPKKKKVPTATLR